jgi:prophage antirepressor-like protein
MPGSLGTQLAPDLLPGPRVALIIATASYQDPGLSQLRATADDAQILARVLGDPLIGAFDVTLVIDADERQVRRAVDVFLSGRSTGDVVLVYLSCHGILDRRNRLYFAAADTARDQLSSTGIPAVWLLELLEECRARQQIVVLDCCFSGAFTKGSKGDGDLDLERRLAGTGRGRAVLTASRSGEYSFTGDALPGVAVSGSVFTAGLVEGLRTGDADANRDGYVSVDEAYDFAYRYVLSSGAAQTPQRWLSGGEGAIVLARSPTGIAIGPVTPLGDLDDALKSRYPMIRIGAVHELGNWLVGDDPARALTAEQKLRQMADNDDHTVAVAARSYLTASRQTTQTSPYSHSIAEANDARAVQAEKAPEPVHKISEHRARLLADAERAAQSITNKRDKALALHKIATAMAATDPDRAARLLADAEHTAQSIINYRDKALALRDIATAMAATNPDRAARLLDDAEHTTQSITNRDSKAFALHEIATAIAATDPDRAERIAQSITNFSSQASALREVAVAVAATDPDRAERIAQSIDNGWRTASTLRVVAEAVAATDPNRAERIARSITYKGLKVSALCEIAGAMAATNPGRAARLLDDAEHTTQSINDERDKALALRDIATAMAATNPDRAARLLDDAERTAQSITNESSKALLLHEIAAAAATDPDPDDAERTARSIANERDKALALRDIATAMAATNPGRAARLLDDAERTAQSITNERDKALALRDIATAMAATNPGRAARLLDDAERTARSITNERDRVLALCEIATTAV